MVAGTNYFWDSKNGKQTTTSVSAVVSVNRPIYDKEAEAAKIAGSGEFDAHIRSIGRGKHQGEKESSRLHDSRADL